MEKVSDNFLEAKKYADDLVSGKKLANIEQVQAAKRFIDDLKSDKWDFKNEQFDFCHRAYRRYYKAPTRARLRWR